MDLAVTQTTVVFTLFLLFFVLVLAVILALGARQSNTDKKRKAHLARAGDLLGFEHGFSPVFAHAKVARTEIHPKITGVIDGLRVEAKLDLTEADSFYKMHYEVHYTLHGVPAFAATRRTRLGGFTVGNSKMPAFETGDQAFDKVIRMRAHDDDHSLLQYLTPDRRRAIGSLLERWSEFEVTHISLRVNAGSAAPTAPSEIVADVNQLVSVASILRAS